MKRFLAVISLVAVATTATGAGATDANHAKGAATHRKSSVNSVHKKKMDTRKSAVAPADEYFGKLKMSVLGMRNTINDLGRKIEASPEKAESIFANTDYLEDAIHDWQKKYPQDSWLPRYVYSLAHLYGKVPSEEGRNRAKKTMAWLVERYPHSEQAKSGREELASGTVGMPAAPPAAGSVPQPQASP